MNIYHSYRQILTLDNYRWNFPNYQSNLLRTFYRRIFTTDNFNLLTNLIYWKIYSFISLEW